MHAEYMDLPIENIESAPSLCIRGFSGYWLTDHSVSVNLFDVFFDPSSKKARKIAVARMTMDVDVLENLISSLSKLLTAVKYGGGVTMEGHDNLDSDGNILGEDSMTETTEP